MPGRAQGYLNQLQYKIVEIIFQHWNHPDRDWIGFAGGGIIEKEGKMSDEKPLSLDGELHYKELGDRVLQSKDKFDYALITVIFGSFALSMQFSPTLGYHSSVLLVISWGLYFFSILLGGTKILTHMIANRAQHFISGYRIYNAHQSTVAQGLEEYKNQHGHDPPEEDLKKHERGNELLIFYKSKISKSEKRRKNYIKYFSKLLYVELTTFTVALFLNGLFVALNYLKDAAVK